MINWESLIKIRRAGGNTSNREGRNVCLTLLLYRFCQKKLNCTGLEIATNTVAFVTEFFPFATKISGEVANLQLVFTFALLKQKG